jgi:hypothetical protein
VHAAQGLLATAFHLYTGGRQAEAFMCVGLAAALPCATGRSFAH